MSDFILAIDPGTVDSGYVLANAHTLRPIQFGKVNNHDLIDIMTDLFEGSKGKQFDIAIEMLASYGMPVGRDVLETAVWVGRFTQKVSDYKVLKPHRINRMRWIYRQEEKLTLCHSPKANDATIKHALIDRFAYGEPNFGKGTKKSPGWFYKFSKDVWQAYAVLVTYFDLYASKDEVIDNA
jgi:hypothetical protein